MPTFRIETERDSASGKYYFDIYYPAQTPLYRSNPVYQDADVAEERALQVFKAAFRRAEDAARNEGET